MAKLWSLALALVVGAGFWAAPVSAQTSKVEELERELTQLRSEINSLKSIEREGQGGGDPALATSLKKNVFAWSTEDGKFSFTMNFRFQFRNTYNDQRGDDVENPSAGATNGRDYWNFRIRRAKWSMSGNIFEKDWKYNVVLAFHRDANELIEDAFFTWAKFKEANVSAGQAKVPFNYQFKVSSGRQQFIDRAIASEVFNQSWGKGLWVSGTFGDSTPWVKYWFGIFNGALRSSSDFRNNDIRVAGEAFSNTIDNELMPVLRLETHPMGELADDMVDMRGDNEKDKMLFSVGFAVNWFLSRFNNSAIYSDGTATGGSGRFNTGHDTLSLTLDGHFRWMGLSVNIEWMHRQTNFHNFGPLEGNGITRNRNRPGDLTDNGLTFEAGYFIIAKTLDVGFRYSMVDASEFWLSGSTTKFAALRPDSSEVGLVVGYYLAGHNLKVQFDFTYITHQLAAFAGSVGSAPNGDVLESRSATSFANDVSDYINVWQIRLQLQWIF